MHYVYCCPRCSSLIRMYKRISEATPGRCQDCFLVIKVPPAACGVSFEKEPG